MQREPWIGQTLGAAAGAVVTFLGAALTRHMRTTARWRRKMSSRVRALEQEKRDRERS